MNITLSIDKETAKRARVAAQSMGKSLNQAVREYLAKLADLESQREIMRDLDATSGGGHSGGVRFSREATYADRFAGKAGKSRAA